MDWLLIIILVGLVGFLIWIYYLAYKHRGILTE